MSGLLAVDDLAVSFDVRGRRVTAVDGVSLSVAPGETLGIVGESGSGKSVTVYSLVGLLARNGRIDRGGIRFDGRDLRAPGAMQAVRGRGIAFIFQSPRAALNPIRTVGAQICDALAASRRATGAQARRRAIELMDQVRIERAAERAGAYPHELSGGMCQRILIAMALAAEPRLLIADEPTTGLDVTTQQVVMDTLYELGASRGLATLLITHDVGLAARYCQRVAVMAQGRVVEQGPAADVLERPREPYTRRLVSAMPRPGRTLAELLPPEDRAAYAEALHRPLTALPTLPLDPPLLAVSGLAKSFGPSPAVQAVSFTLARGARLGIVGESGSGKTTTARMLARLIDPSAGSIGFDGQEIGALPSARFNRSPLRRRIQVVFQDPLASLNPRFTARRAIGNPLSRVAPGLSRAAADARIIQAAGQAGFDVGLLDRYPHQLSGGQQARVGIARALIVEPDLLILDEPTSALDVSVQALVLNQLDLQHRRLGLTYILISHDLTVVRLMCDQVLVMRSGRVVEAGDVDAVFSAPQHPYTRALIAAVPHLPAPVPCLAGS